MSLITAAAWELGSPMDVPAIRGITAISVVGIAIEGVVLLIGEEEAILGKQWQKGRHSFLVTTCTIEMSLECVRPD